MRTFSRSFNKNTGNWLEKLKEVHIHAWGEWQSYRGKMSGFWYEFIEFCRWTVSVGSLFLFKIAGQLTSWQYFVDQGRYDLQADKVLKGGVISEESVDILKKAVDDLPSKKTYSHTSWNPIKAEKKINASVSQPVSQSSVVSSQLLWLEPISWWYRL